MKRTLPKLKKMQKLAKVGRFSDTAILDEITTFL